MSHARKKRYLTDALSEYVPTQVLIILVFEYGRKLTGREKLIHILSDHPHGAIYFDHRFPPGTDLVFNISWQENPQKFSSKPYTVYVANTHFNAFKTIYFDDMLPTSRASVLITELKPDFPKKYDSNLISAYEKHMAELYAKY